MIIEEGLGTNYGYDKVRSMRTSFLQPWVMALLICFAVVHGYAKYKAIPALSKAEQMSLLLDGNPDIQIDLLTESDLQTLVSGHDYTVLSFWETWCEPCLEEMPALSEMMRSDHFNNIGFVGIFSHSTKADVAVFVDQFDVEIPMFEDKDKQWINRYEIAYYPTTIIVGPNLEVLHTFHGFDSESQNPLKKLKEALTELQKKEEAL